MKLPLLMFAATFLGSIPAIVVTSHKYVAPTPPEFFATPRHPDSLALYDKEGNLVAFCGTNDGALGDCKIEDGFTVNDVMNAWMHAYEDK